MAQPQAHNDFLPPPTPGMGRALVMALIVHALLVLALAYAVPWHLENPDTPVFSAELWAPLPVQAAPPAPEVAEAPPAPPIPAEPAAPSPPAKMAPPTPAPPPAADAEIALNERPTMKKKQDEREKALQEKQALAKAAQERRLAEQRELEQRKEAKLKAEKLKAEALAEERKKNDKSKLSKADEAKRRKELEEAKAAEEKRQRDMEAAKAEEEQRQKAAEAAKKLEAERQREEQAQSEKLRKEARERALKLAGAPVGNGNPNATGTAAQSAGPSADYGAKVRAAIKPNISSIKELSPDLSAEYLVHTDASGRVISAKLTKRSGDAYWDEAALNAILKTDRLPVDKDGRVPSPMTIILRP